MMARHPFAVLTAILFVCGASLTTARSQEVETGKVTLGGQAYTVDWLLDETFDSPSWTERWTVETQGSQARAEEGELRVRQAGVDKKQGGITIWYNKDLPQNVIVEIDASTGPGEHACNINFFLHARELDGSPLNHPRSGEYADYHVIPDYIFTLTGGYMKGWARARRNPGFHLVQERSDIRAEPSRNYRIVIVGDGGKFSYFLNGTLLYQFQDKEPLPGGRFALRTWCSDINYQRVRIGHILKSAAN